MGPAELGELAAEIFGEDRVTVAGRLDDAIEIAVTAADETTSDGQPGSGGVLITGSVVTAGDARILLTPNGGMPSAEQPSAQPSRHSFTAAELS
jgi:dihydrofolate synthase/folylpolyglutamate synthase